MNVARVTHSPVDLCEDCIVFLVEVTSKTTFKKIYFLQSSLNASVSNKILTYLFLSKSHNMKFT